MQLYSGRSKLIASLLLVAVLCSSSCFSKGGYRRRRLLLNSYLGDIRDLRIVRRVMVIPFVGADMPQENLDYCYESFKNHLTQNGSFQIVPLPPLASTERALLRSENSGRVSAKGLVEIGKRYNVDGILIGRLTAFKAYRPPILGMRIHLFSMHSGETVWAVDQTFDMSKASARYDLLDYSRKKLASENTLHGAEFIEMSPKRFIDYAMTRVVSTLGTPEDG